jgi:ABC-type sugar transport system permease subunit
MWSDIRRYRNFYYFISPFFILFGVFGLYPLLFSFYLSFVKWDGLTPWTWVGMANFIAILEDEVLLTSLWNTLVIGLLYVPPMLIFAFLFAVWLNTPLLRFRAFFRAAFFLPSITPMVVISIVFTLLYGLETGVLNQGLAWIGVLIPLLPIEPIPWLDSEAWSKVSVSILVLWRWTGYNMILMLAGLQGISKGYYEAATVDGAGIFHQLRHITLPLMRPTFLFCGITSLIGTVYMFDEVFVLTRGEPGISSLNFGLYLFNTSFVDFRFGYASAVAYTIAVIVFLLSLGILRTNKSD